MKHVFTVNVLTIVLILVLISIFTYIDSRQFMLEGFTSNTSGGSNLMLFHADWCGHCKKMMPEWDAFQSSYKGSLKIKKIEQGENKSLIDSLNITGD